MNSNKLLLLLAAAAFSLSACDKGGGDKQAAPAGIQGGRIQGTSNQMNNEYCDIGTNSVTCVSIITANGQNTCNPTTIPYTDINSLCSAARNAMNSFACGSSAIRQLVTERCGNVDNNLNPVIPGLETDQAEIRCELEARRVEHYRRWGMSFVQYAGFDGVKEFTFRIPINRNFQWDLQEKFLIDLGKFGRTTLHYMRGGIREGSDTLMLSNRGLNGRGSLLSQSGFAGQMVSLDAEDEKGELKFRVSCQGTGNFKRVASAKPVSKYVCKGISSLDKGTEDVDLSVSYNMDLDGSSIELASKLNMTIQNNRVLLTAADVDGNLTVQSSAFLKEKIQLKLSHGYSDVDVTCSPK